MTPLQPRVTKKTYPFLKMQIQVGHTGQKNYSIAASN
jgi:hypothetical protein